MKQPFHNPASICDEDQEACTKAVYNFIKHMKDGLSPYEQFRDTSKPYEELKDTADERYYEMIVWQVLDTLISQGFTFNYPDREILRK